MDEQGIKQTELCAKTGIGKSAMSQYLNVAFVPKQQRAGAIAEEKSLVRHYHDNGTVIVLTATNPEYDPIILDYDKIDGGEVILHGVVEKVSFNL